MYWVQVLQSSQIKKNKKNILYDNRRYFPNGGAKQEESLNCIQGMFPNLIKYSEKVAGDGQEHQGIGINKKEEGFESSTISS